MAGLVRAALGNCSATQAIRSLIPRVFFVGLKSPIGPSDRRRQVPCNLQHYELKEMDELEWLSQTQSAAGDGTISTIRARV